MISIRDFLFSFPFKFIHRTDDTNYSSVKDTSLKGLSCHNCPFHTEFPMEGKHGNILERPVDTVRNCSQSQTCLAPVARSTWFLRINLCIDNCIPRPPTQTSSGVPGTASAFLHIRSLNLTRGCDNASPTRIHFTLIIRVSDSLCWVTASRVLQISSFLICERCRMGQMQRHRWHSL